MSLPADQTSTAFVPSTPDPAATALVAMLIRYVLGILSGAGIIASVSITDSALMLIASSIVGAATVGWALYERFQTAKRSHAAAVKSAAVGAPVKPA